MLIKEKIERTLADVAPELMHINGDFYVIGASAMILSGIDLGNTEDIDILTSETNARVLKDLWERRIIDNYQSQRSDLFRSFFSRYQFEQMDIEVMGDLEVNTNGEWTLLTVNDYDIYTIANLNIKLPTLEEQRRILTLFGREKDMQRISLIDSYLLRY